LQRGSSGPISFAIDNSIENVDEREELLIAKGKTTKKSKTLKQLPVSKSKKRSASKKVVAKKASNKKPKQISKTSTTKAKHKPQKKSAWKLSPQEQNSMQEVHVWKKENSTFQFSEEVHHGHVLVAEKPDLSKYDPDVGVNVYEAFNVLEYEFSESWSGNPEFSDDISEEERDRLWSLWTEEGEAGLMAEGWNLKVDVWFYGPLSVEEV
jgi:hypothetical protein